MKECRRVLRDDIRNLRRRDWRKKRHGYWKSWGL